MKMCAAPQKKKQIRLTILHHAHQHPPLDYFNNHVYAFQITKPSLVQIHFIVVPHVLGLPKWCFHFKGFATKTCAFPTVPFRVTCSVHLVLYKGNARLRWSRGSVLAFGTKVRGFEPGRSRRIFQGEKNPQHLGKITGHFSPTVPSSAAGCSCLLTRVETPGGESSNV